MEKIKFNQFIYFVLDLVSEFDVLSEMNLSAEYYFMHGGCYELYKVLKHYFKDAICMISNDLDHCATLYLGNIYDATGEREDYAYFHKASLEEIEYMERSFGRGIKELEYDNISKEVNDCGISKYLAL